MNITDKFKEFLWKQQMIVHDLLQDTNVNPYMGEEYVLTTSNIEECFSKDFNTEINMQKLAYYTKHELIPAPKRVGISSVFGGSQGKYKLKTAFIIWYIEELRKRGIKSQDELRLHIYNYFHSKKLPPHPVHDTPFTERYIYTWRINKGVSSFIPHFEDLNVNISENESIPCKKATFFSDGKPFASGLFTTRNLTRPEYLLLQLLRSNKQFVEENGVNIYENIANSYIRKKHLLDLGIFLHYPRYRAGETKKHYHDLLNTTYTFKNI